MGHTTNEGGHRDAIGGRITFSQATRLIAASIAPIFLSLLLAACSSAAGTAHSPSPSSGSTVTQAAPMSAAQTAALADGKVSYAEYQAGFRRFVACESKAGYAINPSGQINEIYQFMVSAAAVDSGVDARCYASEFKQIDEIWQVSREDTSPQAAAYRACLIKGGITPAKTETKMYNQLLKAKIDPGKCY
jgi:hypothetical protein